MLWVKVRVNKMKFTFKKHIATGMYRSFELDNTDIKMDRKVVGTISESRDYDDRYGISFMIKKEKTKSLPAPFKWVRLKKRFGSENDARTFVRENNDVMIKQFELYQQED